MPQVELIWKSKWSFVKVLYLVVRYFAFVDVPLAVFCEFTHLSSNVKGLKI